AAHPQHDLRAKGRQDRPPARRTGHRSRGVAQDYAIQTWCAKPTAAAAPTAANPTRSSRLRRGRLAQNAASARKSGKSPSRKRGRLTSGTRSAGEVRTISNVATEKSP